MARVFSLSYIQYASAACKMIFTLTILFSRMNCEKCKLWSTVHCALLLLPVYCQRGKLEVRRTEYWCVLMQCSV